ncbi:MAG: ATP-binding protein, partial [Rhodospirillales bacterium]|nr:ATP-binding protein [Rhodospirillales bacterium]
MPTLDELIIRELNPFDQYVTGHILEEDLDPTEDAIHRPVLEAILAEVEALRADRRRQTRTLLLVGDSGSGKSFLLKRLRTALGKSASLAYVPPWPHTGCLRRHILAQIIESLRHKAPRAKDTQLIVWMKDLLKKWIKELKENPTLYKSDQNDMRRSFIKYMRKTAPNGIHNPDEFFGVLYDLSSEELHDHACDWLRGVHIDEEAAATLGNPDPIDDDAKA